MSVLIDTAIKGYIFLLLDMWPVLIIAFFGLSLSFYDVQMPKTAVAFILIGVTIVVFGWAYT